MDRRQRVYHNTVLLSCMENKEVFIYKAHLCSEKSKSKGTEMTDSIRDL